MNPTCIKFPATQHKIKKNLCALNALWHICCFNFFMLAVNLNSFKERVRRNRRSFRLFLSRLQKQSPRGLDKIAETVNKEVWREVDCLTCANCCKTMSPTYNRKDIQRISAHLGMKPSELKEKWLVQDIDGDWLNQSEPCQFLDLKTNMCSIYEVRPDDCAGFPHITKKKMVDYMHVHKQNVEYCPATYKMVEKMKHLFDAGRRKD
jgi:Fe-S-cluster containining protein